MAELKIPQKTLQDNFNLQDFKDDFNALNSEIEENKTLTDSEISRLKEIANTWETFKNTGGEINGDIAIEKHLANLRIGDSFNIKTHDQNTELSSDWNKSIVLRVRSNASDSASYVRLNGVNFAGNGNMSLGEESTPWNDIYLKGVSKSQTGYTKLPNGMLLQWGMIEVKNQYEDMNIWYPVSFPEYCLGVWFESHMNVHNDKREWVKYGTWNNHDLNKFTFRMEGATNWVYPMWFAIGY